MEKEIKDLRSSMKSLKRKFTEFSTNQDTPVKNLATSTTSSTMASSIDSTVGVDSMLKIVEHITGTSEKEVNECIRQIAMSVFSIQDLVSCSRTGKKTTHSPGNCPRPALDHEKMKLVEKAVILKCSISMELFKKKFDNLVKMIRRSNKAASN